MKKYMFLIVSGLMMTLVAGAQSQYKAGDVAADFRLKNVNGETVSLSEFGDAKGFVVTFWCNSCPVVKKYDQRLQDIHAEFASKGYPVIAINPNDKSVAPGDSYEEMQKVAKSKKYQFEYLYDETQETARAYGATNTPHVYLLSKNDGKFIVEYVGAIDNNADDASAADKKYLADAINSLLKGESPAVKGTKAVGCTIKWKKS
ncbi:MAG: thioredoxin family protein [Bacteroidales bacterium]|jgi:peroxiredoxin|nr:thioredoxin family protein [Bacteroidales bacterium]